MKLILSTLPKCKTLEQVFFKAPLALDAHGYGSQDLLVDAIQHLIWKFDSKPFLVLCATNGCRNTAVCCSVHIQTAETRFWCASCTPTTMGSAATKIAVATSFHQVVALSKASSISRTYQKQFAYKLVRSVGRAKGLPRNVTKKAGWLFFGT